MSFISTDTFKYFILQVKCLFKFLFTQIYFNTSRSRNLNYSYLYFISMAVTLVLSILTNHHTFIFNLTRHKKHNTEKNVLANVLVIVLLKMKTIN
jgi:hypothetical protein